jgi:dTDP-4-amino-4,6-dideoxygalactose transaminase
MPRILAAARVRSIPVIEDCCHAVASTIDGRLTGTMGVAAFYSFEWGKPIVAGVGGAVLAHDDDLRRRLHSAYGTLRSPPASTELRLRAQFAAYRVAYRPSVFWQLRRIYHATSALGLSVGSFSSAEGVDNPEYGWTMSRSSSGRLKRVLLAAGSDGERAVALAGVYASTIPATIERPTVPASAAVVPTRYPLFVDDRASLTARARRARVELGEWYRTPVHPLTDDSYSEVRYQRGSCPQAERAAARIVSLPTNRRVRDVDVERAAALFGSL